ncbi:alpha/beta hydrolase [Actinoallomurus iriomotensis]|uniref:Esterase n=1 Tax=Actinoallomurus iriomotensis TaxID=478107 RepID=A0A9W6S3D5_9ACTN|nr:alpha/beta hydrolase-fold protein [Actinoallomurus iriomotensis]GLY87821.1 esterase [Actinoallomurus iriomotensis]
MFGPQGFAVFAVLLVLFAAALFWLTRVRHVALKVVAGVLAFPPAMMFGVALVNDFYGYYDSWDDAWRDLTNQAPASVARVPDLDGRLDQVLREAVRERQARKNGFAMETTLPGPQSRIIRQGVIYLPPQYFQKPYAAERFPVVELIHGSPGTPGDYEGRLKISGMLRKLIAQHKARPVVLVIPDADGGLDRSTQCLNTVHGEQDETYLATDVPNDVAGRLRVQRPGPAWGIAGFSEGGFCAANLALRHPDRYGAAAALSGYFEPLRTNRLPRAVDPFAGDRSLRAANSPLKILARAVPPTPLPRFWVMSGNAAQTDMVQAQAFMDLVKQYQPQAPFLVIKGGQHNYVAWRAAFPKMFTWVTAQI